MNEPLARAAIPVVAAEQPCKPNDLVSRLRKEYGASHADANQTMLALIRDGRLKRTFTGKLQLP
jgi:hypothetical protein